jgi:hypothetical protein
MVAAHPESLCRRWFFGHPGSSAIQKERSGLRGSFQAVRAAKTDQESLRLQNDFFEKAIPPLETRRQDETGRSQNLSRCFRKLGLSSNAEALLLPNFRNWKATS